MVLPFPNEIWLDIFHGLAKEGEYDTLERCRVVCRGLQQMAGECLSELLVMVFVSTEDVERIKVEASGGKMQRWKGPQEVLIQGGLDWPWNAGGRPTGRRPIPHLATFASRLGGRWPSVAVLHISNAVWRARDLDADAVFRDLARFPSITSLYITDVVFPTILTLGRLVCALPCLKKLELLDVQFSRQPFEASTISQFRLLPRTQLETLTLDSRLEIDSTGHGLRPSVVELVDFIASVSNRKFLFPRSCSTQVYLWSAVRTLHLSCVIFPSVATFARLLCALPSLETLVSEWSCTFVNHDFDLRSIPMRPGLPPRLVTLDLKFCTDVDPRSIADLVDFFITTGIGHQLQDIKVCLSSPGVTTQSDVNRLVRHSGQSLHRLDLDSPWAMAPASKDVWLAAARNAAPYFDVSENMCLERLGLTVNITHESSCTPAVDILSHVTSAHISKILVRFRPYSLLDSSFDVDWGALMDGLPQIDAVLSLPIFGNLVHVFIGVCTREVPDGGDEERVDELRARLPKLDERGILGIYMNGTRSWKHYGIERSAAQGTVVIEEMSGADGDTGLSPCDDSEAVPAELEVVSPSLEARANAQPPSSSYPTDSRVAAEGCDDGFGPQGAMAALEACSGTPQQMSSPLLCYLIDMNQPIYACSYW
ncbi:predicted protein [Postia placenta Mad-698-R]|nr:predicted protein [Postia placenta Mad-698-R]